MATVRQSDLYRALKFCQSLHDVPKKLGFPSVNASPGEVSCLLPNIRSA